MDRLKNNQLCIKCVVVGDGAVGKTCLLISYTTNKFPSEYIPTVFDNYSVTVMLNNEPYLLGQDGFEDIRSAAYSNADVFAICFDISKPLSFENVKKWHSELKRFSSRIPIVIVGMKIDLRTDSNVIETLAKSKQKPISRLQGQRLAKELNAFTYNECSSLTQVGMRETFNDIIAAALNKQKREKKCLCTLF